MQSMSKSIYNLVDSLFPKKDANRFAKIKTEKELEASYKKEWNRLRVLVLKNSLVPRHHEFKQLSQEFKSRLNELKLSSSADQEPLLPTRRGRDQI